MSLSLPAAAADLAQTAAAFAQWRAGTPVGARIPEDLWSQAVALAARHGVSKVAATLRLDVSFRQACMNPARGSGNVEAPRPWRLEGLAWPGARRAWAELAVPFWPSHPISSHQRPGAAGRERDRGRWARDARSARDQSGGGRGRRKGAPAP
jgi:hypothetical protein